MPAFLGTPSPPYWQSSPPKQERSAREWEAGVVPRPALAKGRAEGIVTHRGQVPFAWEGAGEWDM